MKTKASKHVKSKSGSLLTVEDIGPQMVARNLLTGDELECGPPLGLQKDCVVQPIRDRLLGHRRAAEEFAELLREKGLATGDRDGPLKGGNIRFIHEHLLYKRTCISVNKPSCMTGHKGTCIVQFMARKQAQQPQSPRDDLRVGHDGRVASVRLREAFDEWKDRVGGTQERLCAAANRIMGYGEEDADRLKQQEISQFLNGLSDLANSARASAIAESLGVRPAWLQHGSGSKYEIDKLTAIQVQALRDLGVQLPGKGHR